MERLGKIEDSMTCKGKLQEEKGSCSVKLSVHEDDDREEDDSEDDVMLLHKIDALQGKSVALSIGSTNTIVGFGTLIGAHISLNDAPMPKNCICVSVDEFVDENAPLPFPIPDVCDTMGSAIGSHVAWPIDLVLARDEMNATKSAKKPVMEKLVKNYASLPSTLKLLYCFFEKTKVDQGICLLLDEDVFGLSCKIWIHYEDVIPFCDLDPISRNCITAYIWHMHSKLKKKGVDRFLFTNPFAVSYAPKVQRNERARHLASRLENASLDQMVLVPCNVGEHWIFTIIQPHKELVLLMDPLCHRNRDSTWKYVVDTAMTMFNANLGKKGKKTPTWEVIKGPIQPDAKQCGFYVIRFMKDLIEGLQNDDTISIGSLFKKREYSLEMIDEVREEWAAAVTNLL